MPFVVNVQGFDGTVCRLEKSIADTIDSIIERVRLFGDSKRCAEFTHDDVLLDDPPSTIGDEPTFNET